MEDEEDIAAYLLRVAEVVNSLKGLDEKIEESTIVQKVLRSLPDRFDSKISTIEEAKDIDTLKMDELHGILTTYEMRKGHYAAKCPHKHDSDDEGNSKRMAHKKKGFNKKNFFSKQDESDEDEFMAIKKKSNEESDHDEILEALFMALADDGDSGLEGNVDELLISAIEENDKLQNKIISLKVENEEIRRREDLLEANLKEKEETCEERGPK
eukprot:PITA_03638